MNKEKRSSTGKRSFKSYSMTITLKSRVKMRSKVKYRHSKKSSKSSKSSTNKHLQLLRGSRELKRIIASTKM